MEDPRRCCIAPEVWRYAERRRKGLELPPDNKRWTRSNIWTAHDHVVLQQPMDVRYFDELDWSKRATRVEDEDVDPFDEPAGIQTGTGDQSDAPAVDAGVRQTSAKEIHIGCSTRPSQLDEDAETTVPEGFYMDPDRPWTQKDDEYLLDFVFDDELHNFTTISRLMQRAEDHCHARYRYLAKLEVEEPRIGNWSHDDDEALMRFRGEYRSTDWDRMAFHLGTTTAEARHRWQHLTFRDPDAAPDDLEEDDPTASNHYSEPVAVIITSDTDPCSTARASRKRGREANSGTETMEMIPAKQAKRVKLGDPPKMVVDGGHHNIVRLAGAPEPASKGRKRARDADVQEEESEGNLPNRKARRIGDSKPASEPKVQAKAEPTRTADPPSNQSLRRSSRTTKVEFFRDNHTYYYPVTMRAFTKTKKGDDAHLMDPSYGGSLRKVTSKGRQGKKKATAKPEFTPLPQDLSTTVSSAGKSSTKSAKAKRTVAPRGTVQPASSAGGATDQSRTVTKPRARAGIDRRAGHYPSKHDRTE